MTISDFYSNTIIKVNASFGFSEFACSPHTITEALRVKPDEIALKGLPRKLKSGHILETPFNSWSIYSESNSKDINEHIRQLLQRLKGLQLPFSSEWGEPYFDVLWKGNYLYAGSGPFYEPDVLVGIAALNAAIYQDIYQVDQDDGDIENKTHLTRIPK